MTHELHCCKMKCPVCHVATWHVLTKEGTWRCLECAALDGDDVALEVATGEGVSS